MFKKVRNVVDDKKSWLLFETLPTKNFALLSQVLFHECPIRKKFIQAVRPKTAENSKIKVGNNLLFLPCANPSVHVWTMGSAKADWEGQD